MGLRAYTPSIAEIGRYLEQIYTEPDFQTVSIDKLPGYPEAVVQKYYLNGKLIGISSGGAGGPGHLPPGLGGGVTGGYGAPGGLLPGGGGGGAPPANIMGGGGPPGSIGGGMGGGYGRAVTLQNGIGERVYTLAEVLKDDINPLGTAQQRQRMFERALKNVRVKQEPKGFTVNITAALKHALVPPSIPGGPAMPGGGGGMPGGAGGGGGRPAGA